MNELHGRPTAEELVEAVREFLENDVMHATEGRVQFHTRVAINALNTVHRELERGAEQQAAHEERLRALGYANDAELSAAIRSGAADDHYAQIKAAVAASVADKLKVANPKYLDS